MKYSVVIATYNRAADLRETLASLAGLRPDGPWEVIVVDNNSPDDTRAVVEAAQLSFPVSLIYCFEREQGRSPALNAGIRAASGSIVVTTMSPRAMRMPLLRAGLRPCSRSKQ